MFNYYVEYILNLNLSFKKLGIKKANLSYQDFFSHKVMFFFYNIKKILRLMFWI